VVNQLPWYFTEYEIVEPAARANGDQHISREHQQGCISSRIMSAWLSSSLDRTTMSIRAAIARFADRAAFALQRHSEIARYEGIILADLRGRSPHFREILLAALRLLHVSDSRRFRRVQVYIRYIVNLTLGHPGAQYDYKTRTCRIDFEEPNGNADHDFYIGFHACNLVHEATHGEIEARGIPYDGEFRCRIERLCVQEENRFVQRLRDAGFVAAERLGRDFDESDWDFSWNASRKDRVVALFKRLRQ
jgi:hypothetical protein